MSKNRPVLPKVVTHDKPLNTKHRYIIITKSQQGQFINFSYAHKHWDFAIHNAIYIAKEWLSKVNDELVSIMLISSKQSKQAIFADILNRGADYNSLHINNAFNHSNDEKTTPIIFKGAFSCRQVTGIRQIECSKHKLYYGSTWSNILVTVISEQGYYFIFACQSLNDDILISVKESIKYLRRKNKLPNNNQDPVKRIIFSHKRNQKHYNIIKRLLKNKQPIHFNIPSLITF